MGKLVLAFLFYSASAGFAVHEAIAPPSQHSTAAPVARTPIRVDRVNEPETVDPTRFAKPFYVRPLPPPAPVLPEPPPPPPVLVDVESGDYVDTVDKCPAEAETVEGRDNDGCPQIVID